MRLDAFARRIGGSVVAVWLVANVASFFVPEVEINHGLNVAATAVVTALFGGAALSGRDRRNGERGRSNDGPGQRGNE